MHTLCMSSVFCRWQSLYFANNLVWNWKNLHGLLLPYSQNRVKRTFYFIAQFVVVYSLFFLIPVAFDDIILWNCAHRRGNNERCFESDCRKFTIMIVGRKFIIMKTKMHFTIHRVHKVNEFTACGDNEWMFHAIQSDG